MLENSLTRPSTDSGFAGVRKCKEGQGQRKKRVAIPRARVSAAADRGPSPGPPPRRRRSLPQRRYLFPHVIHDAHEARQQFSFLSSSKFLLGLLLAALLHPGGCHPPSTRFTPGARRAGRGVARSRHAGASVYQTPRPGPRLQRPAPEQRGAATAVGQGPAATRRSTRGGDAFNSAASPAEAEPGGGVCALRSRGRGRYEGSRGRSLRVTAARRSERR